MLRRLSCLAGPQSGVGRSMRRSLGINVPGLNLLPGNWNGRSSHSAAWGLKSPIISGEGSGQGRAAGGRGRGRRGRLEDEESGSISWGARMVMSRRPIRGGGASNRQIDDALYWAMVRIRIANGEEETSVLGLSSTLTRLADEAEERRPIGEGWFNVPTGLTDALTGRKGSSADSVEGLKKKNEEDDVPWWERYMKGKDELDPRGIGAFVNLFRKDKNPRKLGPLWHMYQFCIAMIPSLFIICLANSVTGRDLSKMPEQFTSADKIAFAAMRKKEYEKECAEKGIPVPSTDKKDLPWYRRF